MTQPDKDTLQAVGRCIRWRIPFALIQKPHSADWIFFASCVDAVDTGGNGLEVSFFGEGAEAAPFIPATLTARDILDLPSDFVAMPLPEISAMRESTRFMPYYAALHQLIDIHKRDGGKTVFSRLIALRSMADPLDVALEYFAHFPESFKALYFTRATGLWIVATPELLLRSDSNNRFETMSLAGTRWNCPPSQPWDKKNVEEHEYVTSHIVSTLACMEQNVDVSPAFTLEFGPVQHLCEHIYASGHADFSSVLSALSPTPAVCGTPVSEAMSRILYFETHSRHCYGGWIMLREGKSCSAYVNLRSALVTPDSKRGNLYNIYAGGGITASSVPLDEWNEAGNKASRLFDAIAGKSRTDVSSQPDSLCFTSIENAFSRKS